MKRVVKMVSSRSSLFLNSNDKKFVRNPNDVHTGLPHYL